MKPSLKAIEDFWKQSIQRGSTWHNFAGKLIKEVRRLRRKVRKLESTIAVSTLNNNQVCERYKEYHCALTRIADGVVCDAGDAVGTARKALQPLWEKENTMTPKEYIENVLVTESCDMEPIQRRLQDKQTVRLLHAVIGIGTEAGELQDVVKKKIFYGKEVDRTHLIEELGDLMFYVGVACHVLNVDLEEVMERNIAKLRVRYGGKFTEAAALKRDLDEERKALEEKP